MQEVQSTVAVTSRDTITNKKESAAKSRQADSQAEMSCVLPAHAPVSAAGLADA